MSDQLNKYTEANRIAWNNIMPKHQAVKKAELDKSFAQPGYTIQHESELLQLLKQVDIAEKDVIHLCCNNGSELLSLKNMGANRCVGIDISDAAIAEASERAENCQIDCQFIRSDIYQLSEQLHNSFDIVHITAGGIGWLPDIQKFYQVVSKLLRPGGIMLMHEMHPVSEMMPFDDSPELEPLQLVDSYFQSEPIEEQASLDYIGKEFSETSTQYWKVHSLSELIMGAINNGLTIEHFSEHDRDISNMHQRQQAAELTLPLSMLLVVRKNN